MNTTTEIKDKYDTAVELLSHQSPKDLFRLWNFGKATFGLMGHYSNEIIEAASLLFGSVFVKASGVSYCVSEVKSFSIDFNSKEITSPLINSIINDDAIPDPDEDGIFAKDLPIFAKYQRMAAKERGEI